MKVKSNNLNQFSKISLTDYLNSNNQLFGKRSEQKFLIHIDHLDQILNQIESDFICVQHEDQKIFRYRTIYLDTTNFKSYKDHHQGKYNRYKLRYRQYINGIPSSFLEFKEKKKNKFTKKTRTKVESTNPKDHQKIIEKFLKNEDITFHDLQETIQIEYDRITLINSNHSIRLTIDFNINAQSSDQDKISIFPKHFILEIKQNSKDKKIQKLLLKNYKIRETSFSKYCLSLAITNPKLKSNKWKNLLKKHYE